MRSLVCHCSCSADEGQRCQEAKVKGSLYFGVPTSYFSACLSHLLGSESGEHGVLLCIRHRGGRSSPPEMKRTSIGVLRTGEMGSGERKLRTGDMGSDGKK